MDWQSYTALAIALAAGAWAGWKVFKPIINEFRKKKTADGGCCGCGADTGACGKPKNET